MHIKKKELKLMKVLNISNPEAFFTALDSCKGDVFLMTSEGDKINLKSKLCQYIALSKMFSEAKIDDMEIEVTNSEDLEKIVQFLIRG